MKSVGQDFQVQPEETDTDTHTHIGATARADVENVIEITQVAEVRTFLLMMSPMVVLESCIALARNAMNVA